MLFSALWLYSFYAKYRTALLATHLNITVLLLLWSHNPRLHDPPKLKTKDLENIVFPGSHRKLIKILRSWQSLANIKNFGELIKKNFFKINKCFKNMIFNLSLLS